jgi:hypothetical protein
MEDKEPEGLFKNISKANIHEVSSNKGFDIDKFIKDITKWSEEERQFQKEKREREKFDSVEFRKQMDEISRLPLDLQRASQININGMWMSYNAVVNIEKWLNQETDGKV